MSRSFNALTALAFGYVRLAVAIASGFVVLPLVLARIDSPTYSRWLVTIEILSYLGFAELGIANLMPWLVAERDGRKDREALRQLLADARGCCTVSVVVYLCAFFGLWLAVPSWIGLSGGAISPLGGAVLIVAGCTSLGFFGRMHLAALEGLQDYVFLGSLMLVQSAVGVGATIALLLSGAGPMALAVGLTVPLVLGSVAATWRLWQRGGDLVWGLPWPSWRGMARLAADAGGTWMGGVGGRLTLSSNAMLITAARGTDLDVIRFVCTSKLGDMLMMQSWQIIDSGLVGLAQLHGEGRKERVRQIVALMTRLTLIGSGAAAIVILGFNPSFVALWLGPEKFGGLGLNAATTVTLLGLSLLHVLSVTSSILGYRIGAGALSFFHGLVYASLAIGLGLLWGPLGVAMAGGGTALLVALPLLSNLQSMAVGQTLRDLLREIAVVWLPRAVIPLIAAACLGASSYGGHWEICAPVTFALGLAYVWLMRPLMIDIPLPRRLHSWTRRLRLIPGAAS
ncbi:MAG: hypothetical protein SH850_26910 [Planctomycetaceae bacterium]|nr:hypothetical protein [Planctomycetaceae bacterium]